MNTQMAQLVYLDHNASSPLRPQAAAAMAAAMDRVGNPSSVHRFGRLARRVVEDAREGIAALVGTSPGNITFTSGGTEANAIALRSIGMVRVLASAVEHVSVLHSGVSLDLIAVDANGVVDLAALERMLAEENRPTLISVMLANNETGVTQPVRAVVELAQRYQARVHCDATQAVGKMPVQVSSLGCDLMTLSAHKFGGPAGIGALVASPDLTVAGLFGGGGQERGRRAGTQNLIGIAGFGAAADDVNVSTEQARIRALRERLEAQLQRVTPNVQIMGQSAERLANTTCFAVPHASAETLVIALDLEGVAVSAGAACSSGKVSRSHVLQAMNVGEHLASGALRISLGWTTSDADVERFIAAWSNTWARHEGAAAGRKEALAGQAARKIRVGEITL